jgi:hypothetical protein
MALPDKVYWVRWNFTVSIQAGDIAWDIARFGASDEVRDQTEFPGCFLDRLCTVMR